MGWEGQAGTGNDIISERQILGGFFPAPFLHLSFSHLEWGRGVDVKLEIPGWL